MRRALLLLVGLLAFAGVAVASSGGASKAQPRWVITNLGTLHGRSSAAVAVNEHGQVIGSWDPGSNTNRAFIWQNGKMRDLGSLGNVGAYVEANHINDRSQVVGMSDTTGSGGARGFLWENGRMRGLGTLDDAVAINERGQVVGTGGKGDAVHALLWENGKTRDLTPRFKTDFYVLAINERGTVLMRSQNSQPERGFVWAKGALRDLGSLGGGGTVPAALNDQGQVVGTSKTKSGAEHAFLWENGKIIDLGVPRGQKWSRAAAINNRGQVIGLAGEYPGATFGRVWLWQRGKMTDLGLSDAKAVGITNSGAVVAGTGVFEAYDESVVPLKAFSWDGSRWTRLPHLPGHPSAEATALNNHGQIVGRSGPNDPEGDFHAVLWTLKG